MCGSVYSRCEGCDNDSSLDILVECLGKTGCSSKGIDRQGDFGRRGESWIGSLESESQGCKGLVEPIKDDGGRTSGVKVSFLEET